MNVDFYRDDFGFERVRAEAEVLVGLLEADLLGAVDECQLMLRAIADLRAGRRTGWQVTGDEHTIALTQTTARVENDVIEGLPPLEIPLSEFQTLIERWLRFVDPESAPRPRRGSAGSDGANAS